MKTTLITGAGGLLAPYLIELSREFGRTITTSKQSGDIPTDLCDKDSVQKLINRSAPDWVVHTAAMTDVNGCELNPDEAYRNNLKATQNLINALSSKTHILFLSTDQVYPDCSGLHKEEDVCPINVYGKSKLAAELVMLKHPCTTIIRTNFFGPSRTHGRNSLDDYFVKSFNEHKAVSLYSDIKFSPLHMKSVANIGFELLERRIYGTYNLGSRCGLTKADFGLEVAKQLSIQTTTAKLVLSTTIPNRAPRAKDLRMDLSRIEKVLNRKMPTLISEIKNNYERDKN